MGDSQKTGNIDPIRELTVLAELSGLQGNPQIYRVIVELLRMQIDPEAIYKLLRSIRRFSRPGKTLTDRSKTSINSN